MSQILVNPRGAFRRDEHPIAPRPASLAGKVLGLIDNSKDNADIFLEAVSKGLQAAGDITEVLWIRKSVSGTPAPYTEAFLDRCGIVVNAFGD